MFAIPLAVALAVPVPQEPTTPPALDLAGLSAQVDAAHRPHGPVPEVTAFRSDLVLEVLDIDAAQTGAVSLLVQFMEWRPPGKDRSQPLIRYELREPGSPSVRGRDRNGPWHLFQGEAQSLRQAQFAEDLAACERHTNLARQLLRFLDPGAVLRSLTGPTPVTETELSIDRATRVACLTVEGDLPAFPLLQQGGDDAPVRLRVFVDKNSFRLVAVDASPLVDGKPAFDRTERVLLTDLHERDDLLVPRSIQHLFRKPDGKMRLQSRANLASLQLRPEFRAEDFDRPR